jgi:signal transduction histidine kinase
VETSIPCPLSATLARRLRDARTELTARWLERISARVALDANRVFPTDDLLDHVPLLIGGIADYLENPAEEIAADVPVMAKAMELGELRHAQGFDVYEILKEYELLGGVLFTFLSGIVDAIDEPCTRSELLQCTHRLFRAITLIQQSTTTQYLRKYEAQIREREDRLRGFNRMVSHELKNRTGAIMGAAALLAEPWIKEPERERFVGMVADNAARMNAVLQDLVSLSRLDMTHRQHRHVLLPQAAQEAARQLREQARSRGVQVKVDEEMPPIEVNAAAVELCLTNYVSNAIKYSDASKPERWVRVSAAVRPRTGVAGSPAAELVIGVHDNGIGVPPAERKRLFDRFFRTEAATITGVEGTGLGLSIVRDTAEELGGRAWAEFDQPEGSAFFFSLPSRRADDGVRDEAG